MRKLKEHWCQEKLEFCRPDGTNEAHHQINAAQWKALVALKEYLLEHGSSHHVPQWPADVLLKDAYEGLYNLMQNADIPPHLLSNL